MSSEKMQGRQMTDTRYQIEEENTELEIDLVELMYRLLEKVKWIIAAALVGMLIAGVITKFFVTPTYEATSKLYVQERKDKVVDLSAINLSTQLAADYVQVFNNWHVHESVIRSLDLPYTYKQIQRMLTITIPEDTRIIEITVTSKDPQEAYDIAMAYARVAPAFIEAKMETSRPNVFEEARIPTKPSAPNTKLNIAIGTFLGAAAAVAVIFIQFVSDDRVRNAEILQKRLGLATLGMMPVQDGAAPVKAIKPTKEAKKNQKGGRK